MSRIRDLLEGCWVLAVLLTGCSGKPPVAAVPTVPAAQPSLTAVAPPTTPVLVQPGLAPSSISPTVEPVEPAQPTNTPSSALEPEFAICTPLQDHTLDVLRLIVSDPYRPPPGKSDARHHGVDFSYYRFGERDAILGVGVQAVLPGKVAAALADSYPFGSLVIVETGSELLPGEFAGLTGAVEGKSLYMLYAHMDGAPLVRIGDEVTSCQLLGAVGKSGNAVEPHLHLEARLGPAETLFVEMGEYFAEASSAERAAYQLWRTSGVYRHFDPMLIINYALENLAGD